MVLYFHPQGCSQRAPFPPPSYDDLASQKITERFDRNPEKPADEDVAERVFLILDERIQLRYHCRDDHITASKREFLRRTEVDSKGDKIIMTPDMCISFEVGLGAGAGRAGQGKFPGPSGPSQQLGETGMETHGSQPGRSSLPLGKIKSSHPGTINHLCSSSETPPFPVKKGSPAGYSPYSSPPPSPRQSRAQIAGPTLEQEKVLPPPRSWLSSLSWHSPESL